MQKIPYRWKSQETKNPQVVDQQERDLAVERTLIQEVYIEKKVKSTLGK